MRLVAERLAGLVSLEGVPLGGARGDLVEKSLGGGA